MSKSVSAAAEGEIIKCSAIEPGIFSSRLVAGLNQIRSLAMTTGSTTDDAADTEASNADTALSAAADKAVPDGANSLEYSENSEPSMKSSDVMLGLLYEFTNIYKDKLERLENSSLKMDEQKYLQVRDINFTMSLFCHFVISNNLTYFIYIYI